MPYTQLDDGFYDHPETRARSHSSVGIFVKALNYCGRHLTDGVVPGDTMRELARGRGGKAALDELAKRSPAGPHWLVRDAAGDAWTIDRYFDPSAPWGGQKSRLQVLKERESSRARADRARERKRQEQLPWNAEAAKAGTP